MSTVGVRTELVHSDIEDVDLSSHTLYLNIKVDRLNMSY